MLVFCAEESSAANEGVLLRWNFVFVCVRVLVRFFGGGGVFSKEGERKRGERAKYRWIC
jgi:hypothetical protein